MLYGLRAELVGIVRLGLIAFVAIGGCWRWRWRRLLWPRVPAISWALAIVTIGFICADADGDQCATSLGRQRMPKAWSIDLYLTGVVYRDGLLALARVLVAAAVVADRAEPERVASVSWVLTST